MYIWDFSDCFEISKVLHSNIFIWKNIW